MFDKCCDVDICIRNAARGYRLDFGSGRLCMAAEMVARNLNTPCPMLDDTADDAPKLDQPDPERLYHNYLVTCAMHNVEPLSREPARKLTQEWTDTIAASRSVPPTTH